ncbi:MAG: valine--tRNA ligase, partial [Coriobacteriia bacterium]|nr:valine--tRNA ligase [Coriobacteriia bacterium]
LPLMDRLIPVIADDYVDMGFGTGVVKVTPAHDPNDFEIGQRHGLEQINVFDGQAVVNEAGGHFAGLGRDEARQAVLAELDALGLIDHIEDYRHAVGHCYRCDTTLEPWASEQWFVAMGRLAAPAIEAVRDGRVRFNPPRWANVYFHWMESIRDWCVSRQLWWGHRIPVFYCDACGWVDALEEDPSACPTCGGAVRQDEDVLDTWFSSQLWPFATFGWPDEPGYDDELSRFYPTQVLSTARDIIFLWVARMVMSSMYFLDGTVPFTDVIMHPTVLDSLGNIMSKSRGNGIDPLDLIAEYGADVMRFGLAAQVTGMQDIKFDKDKLGVYRNFTTKIHNAARFVFMNLEGFAADGPVRPDALSLADRWILSRLARLAELLDDDSKRFEFGQQAKALYGFFWNELCDWYIEFSKTQLADAELRSATQRNLVFLLDRALRLLHPMMPFLTESVWQALPHGDSHPSLVVADWPDAAGLEQYIDGEAERSIGLLVAVVGALRSTRARYRISPRQPLSAVVRTSGEQAAADARRLEEQKEQVGSMANCPELTVSPEASKPAQSVLVIADGLEIYIVLEGLLDFAAERSRLLKEITARQADADRLAKKLDNSGFLAKAASEVIAKTRDELDRLESEIAGLQSQQHELQ